MIIKTFTINKSSQLDIEIEPDSVYQLLDAVITANGLDQHHNIKIDNEQLRAKFIIGWINVWFKFEGKNYFLY